jgi:hypothetical protein
MERAGMNSARENAEVHRVLDRNSIRTHAFTDIARSLT